MTGAGAAGVGVLAVGTGGAAANGTGEYNVGTESPAAEQAARDAARDVTRVLDWGRDKKTVTGTYSTEAIDNLDRRPNVRYTEANGTYHAISEEVPWGVDRVDADVVHSNGETGGDDADGDGGAHVVIIDTGIDYTHGDLDGNYVDGKDFVNEEDPMDDNGHGTHVAGTVDAEDDGRDVVGVCTAANLHAAKVLNSDGGGTWADIAAAIEWTADRGHDVGNMSLGGSRRSSTVEDAVRYAYDNGVLLVAAAGNGGPKPDTVLYPAAYEEVIAVSATNRSDDIAFFSARGPEVELAAPGVSIRSTTLGGGTGEKSGTSMASPHVAGAGGQLMDNGYTNAEARDRLDSTAEDLGLSSDEQGNGLVDVAAAVAGGGELSVDGLSATEDETSDDDAEFVVDWSVSDPDGDLDSLDLTLYQLDGDGNRTDGEDSASPSVSGDSAGGTTRLVAAGDDGSGHTYEVAATVSDTDGTTNSATATATESEDTGSAPTVDAFRVSTGNPNNPHAEVTVDWDVSDADGDLDTVEVLVDDVGENETFSNTTDVSGGSASGTDEFKDHHDSGDYDVTLTVTDGAGNPTSETTTVTA